MSSDDLHIHVSLAVKIELVTDWQKPDLRGVKLIGFMLLQRVLHRGALSIPCQIRGRSPAATLSDRTVRRCAWTTLPTGMQILPFLQVWNTCFHWFALSFQCTGVHVQGDSDPMQSNASNCSWIQHHVSHSRSLFTISHEPSVIYLVSGDEHECVRAMAMQCSVPAIVENLLLPHRLLKLDRTSRSNCAILIRQKTVEHKTECQCGRGTGYWCGSCLSTRMGQNIAEVLKRSDWRCPSCLQICNCSGRTCDRHVAGLGCTKMLSGEARDQGYQSVLL